MRDDSLCVRAGLIENAQCFSSSSIDIVGGTSLPLNIVASHARCGLDATAIQSKSDCNPARIRL